MTEVTKQTESKIYFSNDGRQFNSEQQCIDYEKRCELEIIIQNYLEKGVDECMFHINPMSNKIAALIDLYDTYDHWQGEWHCYRPLTQEDIDFMDKWLEFKSIYDYEKFWPGYTICNKVEKFELDKSYIIVVLKDEIYVITPEEIEEKVRSVFENEIEHLKDEVHTADWLHFSEKRNRLKREGKMK